MCTLERSANECQMHEGVAGLALTELESRFQSVRFLAIKCAWWDLLGFRGSVFAAGVH